jgi:hypothetical protein
MSRKSPDRNGSAYRRLTTHCLLPVTALERVTGDWAADAGARRV